jgi:hypothetical protein
VETNTGLLCEVAEMCSDSKILFGIATCSTLMLVAWFGVRLLHV